MTASNRLQLAAAAALLVTAPVAASAAQTAYVAAPVAIQSVDDAEAFISISPYGPLSRYINGLSVQFVNNARVAAMNVEFAVTRDGKTQIFAEKGSYAPGTRIDRELAYNTSTLPGANATVTISKVDFADDSTWTPTTGLVAAR